MIHLRTASAHRSLQPVIRMFTERRAAVPGLTRIRPLSARPDQFLEFYFKEAYRVSVDGAAFEAAPGAVLVGVTSRPIKELAYEGEVETFAIHFQPTGLARLFDMPMHQTVDEGLPLLAALKMQTRELDSGLRCCTTFDARVALAERWVASALDMARAPDGVDFAAQLIARTNGRADVARIAGHVGISARQMQRRFLADVGVTPKFYSRVHRFAAAIAARQAAPRTSWAMIAARCGYSDQAHLVREFAVLGGRTPAALTAALGVVPEVDASMSDFFKPARALVS